MAVRRLISTSLPVKKACKVSPGPNVGPVKLGLGLYLISFDDWDADTIATAWNASAEPAIKAIRAIAADDGSVTFTHQTAGEDFELTLQFGDGGIESFSAKWLLTFLPAPTGGNFTITIGTTTTANITYSSNTTTLTNNIQTALNNALANQCTVSYDGGVVFDFSTGIYAGLVSPTVSGNGAGLTGGTSDVLVATVQNGSSGHSAVVQLSFPFSGSDATLPQNEHQRIVLTGTSVVGASFRISMDSGSTWTKDLFWNATGADVRIALQETYGLSDDDIVVYGAAGGPYDVYWGGQFADTDEPLLELDFTNPVSGEGITTSGHEDDLGWSRDSDTSLTHGYLAVYGNAPLSVDVGLLRFHADSLPAGSTVLSALLTMETAGEDATNAVHVKAYNGAHDAAWPANYAAAAAAEAAVGAAEVVMPIATPGEGSITVDIADLINQCLGLSGFTTGDHMLLVFTSSDDGGFQHGGGTGAVGYSILITYSNTSATDLDGSVLLISDGGDVVDGGIEGGSFTTVINDTWQTTVDYNVTATELKNAINATVGSNVITSATGGPAPGSLITLTFGGALANTTIDFKVYTSFSGVFFGSITSWVSRDALAPAEALNSWDLLVVPGQGTMGVDPSNDSVENFIILKIFEPQDQPSVPNSVIIGGDTDATNAIYIRLYDIHPQRIERAINEAYGHDICRVTRVVHSYEWRRLFQNPAYAGTSSEPLYFWYYKDVFRVVFVNEFADPDTIVAITVGTPNDHGPEYFMVPGIQDAEPDKDFSHDLYSEQDRVYQGFITSDQQGSPTHAFSCERTRENVSNHLSYKFKLAAQYGTNPDGTPIDADHAGIAAHIIDQTIQFTWVRLAYANNSETPDVTILATSDALNWDATPDQIRLAIEAMNVMFVGNVTVVGSLENSWLSEEVIDFDSDDNEYDDLRIELNTRLEYLPLNEYGYELRCSISNIFHADSNYQRELRVLQDIFSVPLPPYRNQRSRFVWVGSVQSLVVGYDTQVVTISSDAAPADVEAALLGIMGQYAGALMPARFAKSVNVTGVALTNGYMEIELCGYGHQFKADSKLFMGIVDNSGSISLVHFTTVGSPVRPEIQTITLTNNPFGGTFTLTQPDLPETTGNLAWNASATAVQTALVGFTGYSGKVVVTKNGFVYTATFNSSLDNIGQLTGADSLNNGLLHFEETQFGGNDSAFMFEETVKGAGPKFFDVPDNWDGQTMFDSGDTLVVDDNPNQIQYGLDQTSVFLVSDLATSRFVHTRRRVVFAEGMKVKFRLLSGAAPTGLVADDYYRLLNVQSNCTFQLADPDTNDPITITDRGTGEYELQVYDMVLQCYARAIEVLALPNRRQSGFLEYLGKFLRMGFAADDGADGPSILLGIEAGAGMTMARIDTIDSPATVVVERSGSPDTTVSAIEFLFNALADATLKVLTGNVGVATYDDESSSFKSLEMYDGSTLTLNNCIINDELIKHGGDIRVIGSSANGVKIVIQS